ncbi:hypothetical protein BT63DRAFT_453322 [Microthyrium microscopicum]|uniref:Uncharacterized protein n=1 Tax=Microthyrium microscopicum TaxID=703497 RepID=A0A6A6UHB9_9PEZI|nr:hypothetical protein BT63DRAFT_453322 [Microthyrium microscopicum]
MDLEAPPVVDNNGARLSSSPALSPVIIDPPDSRVRSIHLETMDDEPLVDPGMRNIDFFDGDTSEEDDSLYGPAQKDGQPRQKRINGTSDSFPTPPVVRCNNDADGPKTIAPPRPPRSPETSARNSGSYQPLDMAVPGQPIPGLPGFQTVPVEHYTNSTRNRQSEGSRLSRLLEPSDIPTELPGVSAPPPTANSMLVDKAKTDPILDLHALTLEAIIRTNNDRSNSVPDSASTANTITEPEVAANPRRRVSILPPPIEVDRAKTASAPIVRTPYPHSISIRKSYVRQSHISTLDATPEAILVLTLRRRPSAPHTTHIRELHIPGSLDITPLAVPATPLTGAKVKTAQSEAHFATLDFDDAHLFNKLRSAYASLAGPWRLLSARTLHTISLTHSPNCISITTGSGCPHTSSRSPSYVAAHGLQDSFSADKLMAQYKHPARGKAQYMWVHWAHRLATTPALLQPPAPAPPADSPARRMFDARERLDALREQEAEKGHGECVAGLEFVQGWAIGRILGMGGLVVILAILGALLWILEGVSPRVLKAGFNAGGERVGAGCAIGLLGLAVGWTMVGMWALASWLVD